MPIFDVTKKTIYKLVGKVTVRQGGSPSVAADVTLVDTSDPDVNRDPYDPANVVVTSGPEEDDSGGGLEIIVLPEDGDGGPVDPIDPDPPPSTSAGFTHSNLSGNLQAFSHPSNLIAVKKLSTDEYWIKDPSGDAADLLVGDRGSGGGAIMDNFMWDYREDAFVWITSLSLQRRRSSDNSVIEEVALPSQVGGRDVSWRAGHRGGTHDATGLFIWGYHQPLDAAFVLPINTKPLVYSVFDGFWLEDATVVNTKFHNIFQKANGFAFEPAGTNQAVHYEYQPVRDTVATRIETAITANDWSHPTWSGSHIAFWSNLNSRIEIHDLSGLLESPKNATVGESTLVRAILVSEVAQAYGADATAWVQYQHGHFANGRLIFSVYHQVANKYGIMVYSLETDTIKVVATELVAGQAFEDTPRPSISHDGRMTAYLTNSGVEVRPVSIPTGGKDPLPETNPFPPANRPPMVDWDNAKIAKADWDEFYAQLPIDPLTLRPKSHNNTTRYALEVGYIGVPINDEVPTMTADGEFYFNVHTTSHNSHNMLRPQSRELQQLSWLLPRRLYRFDMEINLIDSVGWSTTLDWLILFQVWGQFPGHWTAIPTADRPPGRVSPPLALRLGTDGGSLQWELITQGTDKTDGYIPWDHLESTVSPARLGKHRISIWWKKDHTGVDSYVKFDINGVTLKELTNVKLGTPFTVDGADAQNVTESNGGTVTFGAHTPKSFSLPGVEVEFSKFTMYRLE